jgi:hypothetical protein
VALIEVDAVDDPLDRLVERRVVEDHVRRLAAELEGQLLPAPGDRPHDLLADLGRARERDLVHALVLDQLGARATVSGHDVDHPCRQLRLAQDVGEEERRQGRRLGRLEHHRVPGRERGRNLPGEHEQRKVPGDDLPGDADGPRPPVGEGVLELVRPARVVEEVRRRERQVDVAGLTNRLAAVERLEHGELARALLEDARDAEQVLGPLARGEVRPPVREPVAGGADREVDVLGARIGDLRQRLLVTRRHARGKLRRAGLDPLAADEEAVPVLEPDDVARLRRRRVLEGGRNRRAVLAFLDLGHQSIVK